MNTPSNTKTTRVLSGIWSVLNSKLFLLVIVIGALTFGATTCDKLDTSEHNQRLLEQNIIALNSDINYQITKNDELQASVAGYISTTKDLKGVNRELFDKAKYQDGKLITLSSTVIRLTQTETDLQNYIDELRNKFDSVTQISEDTYVIPWQLAYLYDSTNFDTFIGKTTVRATTNNTSPITFTNLGTKLVNRTTQIELTFGQKVVDGQLQVYVESAYPGFSAESLSGVFIDPNTNPYIRKLIKKKHWFTGFGLGVSATMGVNTNSIPIVVIGIGGTYNIYSF